MGERGQISHTELHLQSVKDYVLAYMDSEYKLNDTYFELVNIDFTGQHASDVVGGLFK